MINLFLTEKISQIFYYITGGIGLLLTGIYATMGVRNWRTDIEEKKIREKYPIKNHKRTFRLIRPIGQKPVYLLDIKTNVKRWISSPTKLYELGYNFEMVEEITQSELKKYKDGNKI